MIRVRVGVRVRVRVRVRARARARARARVRANQLRARVARVDELGDVEAGGDRHGGRDAARLEVGERRAVLLLERRVVVVLLDVAGHEQLRGRVAIVLRLLVGVVALLLALPQHGAHLLGRVAGRGEHRGSEAGVGGLLGRHAACDVGNLVRRVPGLLHLLGGEARGRRLLGRRAPGLQVLERVVVPLVLLLTRVCAVVVARREHLRGGVARVLGLMHSEAVLLEAGEHLAHILDGEARLLHLSGREPLVAGLLGSHARRHLLA